MAVAKIASNQMQEQLEEEPEFAMAFSLIQDALTTLTRKQDVSLSSLRQVLAEKTALVPQLQRKLAQITRAKADAYAIHLRLVEENKRRRMEAARLEANIRGLKDFRETIAVSMLSNGCDSTRSACSGDRSQRLQSFHNAPTTPMSSGLSGRKEPSQVDWSGQLCSGTR